jgi:hypothetical protein
MKAAICYLSWNRFEYTKLSIQSIIDNTEKNDFDLIWWDNGSTELGMREWIKKICLERDWKYLFFKRNEGLTRAMNNQMKIMNKIFDYDVFCHISNDIIVPPSWLSAIFRAISCEKVGLIGLNLEEDYDFEIENVEGINLERIRNDGNVGGAHFCIPKKKIYDAIGGFQHVDFGYGQQDANYSLEVKILPENYWIYYLPIRDFHGEDLSKTKKLYEVYQQKIEKRLRASGSDCSGGRMYREKLKNLQKQFIKKQISKNDFLQKICQKKNLEVDKSQLIETNIMEFID